MNLPNKLSVIRMILVPVIVLVMIFPYAQFDIAIPVYNVEFVTISLLNIVVLILFAIASATDFIDGYIARKYNLITSFGKFIDPIADKMLVNTMFVMFVFQGIVPVVAVLIMIWRDTIVDGIRMVSSGKGVVVAAGYLGKIKTVSQMFTIIFILLNNLPFEIYQLPITDFMLWFSVSISVLSGISYFMQSRSVLFESM
ncbi:MAG: CDP-diacylglycerol--glycerol-3-phosphate 3-phosphatidyltransferase [Erysipelothrix sp.]|nr:CDP-diacylglycerol--glycerol-3-phosphate 3-phosphatidyltransferase [Erysipelothrix sp.]